MIFLLVIEFRKLSIVLAATARHPGIRFDEAIQPLYWDRGRPARN
jgi:hypothetical protein